jgi:protein-S-isoprenylcysteine O-methyltransferase Ste14
VHALELKVPPVALGLIIAAAMWLASTYSPSLALAIPWRAAIALAIVGVGLAMAVAGVLAFRKAKTTVNPTKPESTSTVVASGIYGLSRNPMYVGFLLVLAGWGVFLAHVLPFLFLPLFVLYMNRFQIGPEERALSARFGSEYATYMGSVRRWL